MHYRRTTIAVLLSVVTVFVAVQLGCATRSLGRAPSLLSVSPSPQFDIDTRVFVNDVPTRTGFDGPSQFHGVLSRYLENDQTPNGEIPVAEASARTFDVEPADGARITWVGHSTMLVELDGFRVLTDPVWSERVSPFPNVGPKRFHRPGIDFDALPEVDAVIISHDHYDHLDHDTIARLGWRRVPVYVPLGIGSHLEKWGVDDYEELDWWDEITLTKNGRTLTLAATPARHFSGRGLTDRNKTLWASWVIKTDRHSVYFGGDTGYFPGFRTIGEKYGPFDATLLPIGAYDPAWSDIHLNPEEAVQAHLDLGGTGTFLPIHFGTFNLATHGWSEPMERMLTAARDRGVDQFAFPIPGESVATGEPIEPDFWWRRLSSD